MTLAALSPLYTWWPLAFVWLLVIVKGLCPIIVARQQASEPPAELVAAISGWPPPVLADPWEPPEPWTRQG